MGSEWPRLPAFDSPYDLDGPLPTGWLWEQIGHMYDQFAVGNRFEQKSTFDAGEVPVINQSAESVIGWHSEAPGVVATEDNPVVTFANPTCEMRLITRPFSVIHN